MARTHMLLNKCEHICYRAVLTDSACKLENNAFTLTSTISETVITLGTHDHHSCLPQLDHLHDSVCGPPCIQQAQSMQVWPGSLKEETSPPAPPLTLHISFPAPAILWPCCMALYCLCLVFVILYCARISCIIRCDCK